MCGIAGVLGLPFEAASAIAPRMLRALSHRGPDDRGTQVVNWAGGGATPPPAVLVQARLSILDLTPAGHQPMTDHPNDPATPANWIVFNGEIFNFQSLYPQLAQSGWGCRTRCDTEVILNAYRLSGRECVHSFRGMFAWCLIDGAEGTAWFCRDRLGIKPLYLYRPSGGGLLFASELRALLAAGPDVVPPVVSPQAVESFLSQGAVYGLDSIVRGVRLLGPGESLVTDAEGRELSRKTYWSIPAPNRDGVRDRAAAVEQLGATLRDAVKLRLVSDVPLGLFLSGGIDSASLVAVATEVAGTDVRTVCIGFDQEAFDESAAAAAIAARFGTRHGNIRLRGEDVLADLPEVLASIDQPTCDGFNTFFVSRAARRAGLTVALSGLGGDELFGGYASFRDAPRAAAWQRRLRLLPGRTALAGAVAAVGRRGALKAAAVLRREPSLVQMYLLRRELFSPAERRALHALPAGVDPDAGVSRDVIDELTAWDRQSAGDASNAISRFELGGYMRHMLLRDADVFSMRHGLEVRVPLLDHVLVEQAAALPGEWKRPDPRPKPLLVDAVGARLPEAVYTSPKRGFTFPWAAWLRGPMRDRAARSAAHGDVWKTIGLLPEEPLRLWERFTGGDRRVSALQMLALVVLDDFATRHNLRFDA